MINRHSNILILTASFGNGHHAATQALIENIENMFPEMIVSSADIFEVASPKLKDYFTETYNLLTKANLPLYNGLYNLRNTRENVIDEICLKLYYKKLDAYLKSVDPELIISVFPTCAHFAGHYKRHHKPTVKMVTVITDVVGNWEWLHPETDMYFVPSHDVKEQLICKGICSEDIVISGIPVRREFEPNPNKVSTPKNVLIMASSMGKLKISQKLITILGQMPYHYTIVAGNNESVLTSLALMDLPENIKVLGFTDEIPQLMKEADLIVTKPGGATIFEAIETEVPMLIKSSNNGQETYNEAFINKYGLGESFQRNKEMLEKIQTFLDNDSYAESIIRNINQFKNSLEKNEAYLQLKKYTESQTMDATL